MVAVKARIFELATSAVVNSKSALIASGIKGGKANHDKKATKKPTGRYVSAWFSEIILLTHAS